MVCANCNFKETEDATFCSQCGQKFGPHKLTLKEFLTDVFDHVLALETNFFRTMRRIFIPGQLTLDYFNGLRKRYYHPLRLFFVLMVIHIGTMGSLIPYNKIFEEVNSRTREIQVMNEIHAKINKIASDHPDKTTRATRDSIKEWLSMDDYVVRDSIDTLTIRKTSIFETNIPPQDIILLSNDSLAAKYHIRDYWTKLVMRQIQRFSIDPKGMIQYLLGNISWMMLVMIPILAFFMKLLFSKGKRYYIEHLFYLYHWHAAAFLLGTLLVIFARNYIESWGPLFMAVVILFGLIAWKRYYQENWLRTLFKFGSMGVMYICLFALFMGLTSIISFGLF
jgi:hypothetical protein